MFLKFVIVTVALAAVAVAGASNMPKPGPRALDADLHGLTSDNTDTSIISDSKIVDQHKSMAEQSDVGEKRELQSSAFNITIGEYDGVKTLAGSDNERAKQCPQINKCLKQGGTCVRKGTCYGIINNGCKKKCDCCITIETTSAPPTCPKTTCPTSASCPTTVESAPQTCPTCPTTAPAQDTNCPEQFTNIGGCCYYYSIDDGLKANYAGAKAACQQFGTQLNMDINLFEVGTGGCEGDVNLMETISTKVGEWTWCGAISLDNGINWQWERTGSVFSLLSNMWYPNDPRTGVSCLHAFVESWARNRAYFGIASCNRENYYVCQIFK